ncbi:MAG: exosortase C-terminal domain/associated protein EpsI [Bryobacteraceae bacterium]
MRVLHSRSALFLSVALAAQAAVFYAGSRAEVLPRHTPLKAFPLSLGRWQMTQQGVVEPEVEEVLKADDLMTRLYSEPGNPLSANLFVAFFESQRTGKSPHSPKNCLPGSGWVPSSASIISISVPTEPKPIQVNRYVVSNGDSKSVVLYWYQSHGRVVANEYRATFFVVADAIRLNRTDTALVRVVVPVAGNDVQASTNTAVDFVQSFFGTLRQYLPA